MKTVDKKICGLEFVLGRLDDGNLTPNSITARVRQTLNEQLTS
jgi:hypothetical protein